MVAEEEEGWECPVQTAVSQGRGTHTVLLTKTNSKAVLTALVSHGGDTARAKRGQSTRAVLVIKACRLLRGLPRPPGVVIVRDVEAARLVVSRLLVCARGWEEVLARAASAQTAQTASIRR